MSKKRSTRKALTSVPIVTFRALRVNFRDRTITIDGRQTSVGSETEAVDLLILSGDAVFMPKGVERIA